MTTNYLNEYKLYETIFYLFRDLAFKPLLPNVVPDFSFKFLTKTMEYSLWEFSTVELKKKLHKEPEKGHKLKTPGTNKRVKDVFQYSNLSFICLRNTFIPP